MSREDPIDERSAAAARQIALWLIAAAVTATVWGMAAAIFRSDGSSINAYLFLELGWSHETAANFERVAIAMLAVAAVVAWYSPHLVLLVPISTYVLLEAVAGTIVRGYAFSELSPAAHALRYLSPLAWLLMVRSRRPFEASSFRADAAFSLAAAWLLRLGLVSVFLTHGYEAWQLHPEFTDLIITTSVQWRGVHVEESSVAMALRVIGALDIVAAILLLVRPWRVVLIWMVIWGAVTAASRLTSYGFAAYPDFLVRCTHFVAPIALWLLIRARSTGDDNAAMPDRSPGWDAAAG